MPKKILLADDSLTIQKVVELTFSEEDYDVTVVGDGALAIEQVSAAPPDIVLADVMMPKKTGYEVCEFVKKSAATQHVPVLLLVGKFEPFDQDRATRAGADGHILKPFESNVLVRSVTDLLAAAARAQASARPVAAAPAQALPDEATPAAPFLAPEEPGDGVFDAAPAAPFGGGAEAGFAEAGADELPGDPLAGELVTAPAAPRRHGSSTAQLDRPTDLGLAAMETPFTPLPPPSDTLDDPFTQSPSGAFAAQFAAGEEPDAFAEDPLTRPSPAPSLEDFSPRGETRPAPVMAAPEPLPRVHDEVAAAPGLPGEGVSIDDFPEDIVNAIVARVVKRISDDVVREIAWQVVPELAELLIKKKLEELG